MVDFPRHFFQPPWEFRESSLFTAVAVITGFIIQYAALGRGVPQTHLPYNALFLGLFAVAVISAGLAFRNNAFTQWLGGIPLGLCLLVAIALLSLIGGIFPQTANATPESIYQQLQMTRMFPGATIEQLQQITSLYLQLRINQIFSSWPFALTILLFLANLGLSLSWRLVPFKVQNLQFILFHAGFWIALSCGIFGAPDLQRLVMKVDEGHESSIAYSMESEAPLQLPFSVFLHDFSLEEYPPQLFLFDPRSGQPLEELSKATTLVKKGITASWKGVTVEVLDFIPCALPGNNGIPEAADRTAGIAFAKVRISSNAAPVEGWISTGSPMLKPYAMPCGKLLLLMTAGSPKAFLSDVTVHDREGRQTKATLEVNHPITFMGWKLYQMGYDNQAGRWSKYSLIEVIHDPWLPAVYLGFFMIMAGNILFFWNGIKRTEGAS